MTTVVITGSNRGIGLELCRQYTRGGANVIASCRRASEELRELGVPLVEGVDVCNDKDIAHLVAELDGEPVDILISNAGILRRDDFEHLNFDVMLEQYRVNAIGPLRLVSALAGNLRKGSKVAIVSSRVGSIGDNESGNNYGYRASKTAVNMIGTNLRHDLKPRGIAVALLHPGYVATGMTGGNGIPPAEAAAGLIERIDELTLASSGGFWHANGERLPW